MRFKSKLDEYVLADGHTRVEGWLDPGAASATIGLSQIQKRLGVAGDVAEIGVHHGRFFILLSNLRSDGEQATAIDVFEDQHLNIDHSGHGNRQIFERNLAIFSISDATTIIKSDSIALTADTFFAGRPATPVRLFSIDGSHTAHHTYSDICFAASVLADGGVIILDDFYNADWPGVQEGFYRFMQSHRDSHAPVAYGNNKMFIASAGRQSALREQFLATFDGLFRHRKDVEIAGHPTMHFSLPGPAEVFDGDYAPRCKP